MNVTTYERGIEKGEKLGERKTRIESIEALLEVRFEFAGLECMPNVVCSHERTPADAFSSSVGCRRTDQPGA